MRSHFLLAVVLGTAFGCGGGHINTSKREPLAVPPPPSRVLLDRLTARYGLTLPIDLSAGTDEEKATNIEAFIRTLLEESVIAPYERSDRPGDEEHPGISVQVIPNEPHIVLYSPQGSRSWYLHVDRSAVKQEVQQLFVDGTQVEWISDPFHFGGRTYFASELRWTYLKADNSVDVEKLWVGAMRAVETVGAISFDAKSFTIERDTRTIKSAWYMVPDPESRDYIRRERLILELMCYPLKGDEKKDSPFRAMHRARGFAMIMFSTERESQIRPLSGGDWRPISSKTDIEREADNAIGRAIMRSSQL